MKVSTVKLIISAIVELSISMFAFLMAGWLGMALSFFVMWFIKIETRNKGVIETRNKGVEVSK